MKVAEMRQLEREALLLQIEETNKLLFSARFKHAMHQLDNPAEIGQCKHKLAQLKTVLHQKMIATSGKG